MSTFANVRKLRLESLEERTLLAVTAGGFQQAAVLPEPSGATNWIVNTLDDAATWDETDDILSLREAIGRAQTGDAITFDDSLAGGTITLNWFQLEIYRGITIDASSIGGITIDADSRSQVFLIGRPFSEMSVELTGLTIQNGKGSSGGGILILTDNTLTLINCTVSENTGSSAGGIYNYGTLTLINCTVSENTGSPGGGIYNSGTLTLMDSTVSGNTAIRGDGGGIYNWSGTLTLTNTTVSGNSARDLGGGINNYGGTLTLTNCTVSGNTAKYGGGGGIFNIDTLTLTNCTVSGNSTDWDGGGIYNAGTLTLTNCTVSGNSANFGGGGIYNYSETLKLYNSIIAQNTAVAPGNDIYNYKYTDPINAYNTLSSFTGWTESEYCIVYDPSIPLFTDALHGDFTPAENSQAVNKGNNDYVTTETDLAGNPRIVGGIVDIGAYEYQEIPAPTPTEQLAVPTITTGNKGIYVSYGANRHQITWTAVENASGYELAYTIDGVNWSSGWVGGTSGAVGNLSYGSDVTYRVRALGEGPYINSDWSAEKTFRVCPMDVNNDGDISGTDRALMASAWGVEMGDEKYRYNADINGDGNISGPDRSFLSANWGAEVDDEGLSYPQPLAAADTVFAAYDSGDIEVDLGVF